MNMPNVEKIEYSLIDINDEGYCVCMDDDGKSREDLRLSEEEVHATLC